MNRGSPVTGTCHSTEHQQCQGTHHDAAATLNCTISSNQEHWQRAKTCSCLFSFQLQVRLSNSGTKVKLTVVFTSVRPGETWLPNEGKNLDLKMVWELYSKPVPSYWGDWDTAAKEHYRRWMAAQQKVIFVTEPLRYKSVLLLPKTVAWLER